MGVVRFYFTIDSTRQGWRKDFVYLRDNLIIGIKKLFAECSAKYLFSTAAEISSAEPTAVLLFLINGSRFLDSLFVISWVLHLHYTQENQALLIGPYLVMRRLALAIVHHDPDAR